MSTTDHTAAAARRSAAEQERTELRAALQEERRGYIQRGLDDRVAGVDAQLKALGSPPETREQEPPAGPVGAPPVGNPPVKPKGEEAAKPADADDPQANTPATPAVPEAPPAEKKATPARGAKVAGD